MSGDDDIPGLEGGEEPQRSPTSSKTSDASSSGFPSWRTRLGLDGSGMGVWVTALFIVGEMAGGGIVAMPQAFLFTSYVSVAVILGAGLASAFTGAQLGACWGVLQRQWPAEYRDVHHRKPYPAIAFRALGPVAQTLVSICIDITLFGVAVVFLLIASENLQGIFGDLNGPNVSFCVILLVLAALITPVTWLGSPKDFWYVMVGAMGMTGIAALIIIGGAASDASAPPPTDLPPTAPLSFEKFFLGFATIVFAFGGHAAFPTIAHDMKQPHKFSYSITIAYAIIMFLLYLPVGLLGWRVYGSALSTSNGANIIGFLHTPWVLNSSPGKVGKRSRIPAKDGGGPLHHNPRPPLLRHRHESLQVPSRPFLTRLPLPFPVNQELDEALGLPKSWSWKRCLSRSCVMLGVVFVAETVPRFGAILSLIGGSTIAALTFLFPPLCAPILTRGEEEGSFQTSAMGRFFRAPKHDLLLNILIMAVGLVGGASSTYSAILSVLPSSHFAFSLPCYVNATAA